MRLHVFVVYEIEHGNLNHRPWPIWPPRLHSPACCCCCPLLANGMLQDLFRNIKRCSNICHHCTYEMTMNCHAPPGRYLRAPRLTTTDQVAAGMSLNCRDFKQNLLMPRSAINYVASLSRCCTPPQTGIQHAMAEKGKATDARRVEVEGGREWQGSEGQGRTKTLPISPHENMDHRRYISLCPTSTAPSLPSTGSCLIFHFLDRLKPPERH